MRVKATNAGGEAVSPDVLVSTAKAPKVEFTAKVGKNTTTLTKLSVKGLVGSGLEGVKVRCKTVAKGCPFGVETAEGIRNRSVSWGRAFKGHPLKPGTKVVVQVSAVDSKVTTVTLTVRDDQQPKVKRS